jgi:hypothetical protein
LVFRSGVGTQMLIVSSSAMTENSLVARKRPASTCSRISASFVSTMYERPAAIASTFRSSRSMPVTRKPARANSSASGSPT